MLLPTQVELPKEGVFLLWIINFRNKLPVTFDRRSIAGNFRSLTNTCSAYHCLLKVFALANRWAEYSAYCVWVQDFSSVADV